ncbi:MAG: sugar phosphate isomerase/epimerase [Deltaproteobacteria bacterium]
MIGNRQTVADCFINAPFTQLQDGLIDLFLRNRLQPEIGLEGGVLTRCREKDFVKIGRLLKKERLGCTLHAPFLSLDPGSNDPDRRRQAWQSLRRAFDLLDIFEPRSIVCHPHLICDEGGKLTEERLSLSISFWGELIDQSAAAGIPVMFENTYEISPAGHKAFLIGLGRPTARFCLDVGHVMAFAGNSWTDWLPALEPWLGQLHLHDNNGEHDQHVAIGSGLFDFEAFFAYLLGRGLHPLVTLEPHTEESLTGSIQYLTASPTFRSFMASQR